jgi:hypothetical protein
MNDLMFLGKSVSVRISDPWEIGEYLKWQALEAKIISITTEALLLQLNTPFMFESIHCEYFIASPRHEGDTVSQLLDGKPLFCGLTRISTDQANSLSPFDLSKWRGGIAIIGEIELLAKKG